MSDPLGIDVLFDGFVVRLDPRGVVVETGRALPEVLEVRDAALVGTAWSELVTEVDPGPSIIEWLERLEPGRIDTEGPRVRLVGEPDITWLTGGRREPDGTTLVTGRRCDEAELWQLLLDARRQVALGRLARPIAHEFNNVLHLVSSSIACIQSVVDHGDPVSDARPWLTTARTAIERGKNRIRDLQPLLRAERRRVSAGVLVEHLADLLDYRYHGRIELACQAPWTSLECDQSLLVELVVTLLERDDAVSPNLRVRLSGAPGPDAACWSLAIEQLRAVELPPRTVPTPHIDTLVTQLAQRVGITLELDSPALARLVWHDVAQREDVLPEDLMVLVVGPPVLRRQVEAACETSGWDVLTANMPEAAIELVEDYRDELDGIIACLPDSAVDLAALRRAADAIPFVGGDGTIAADVLLRRLCEARWQRRLERRTTP